MLLPPTPQAFALLPGAHQQPKLAHFLANAFDNPPVLYPAWDNLAEAEKLIQTTADLPVTA